jgi:hypothetical protein
MLAVPGEPEVGALGPTDVSADGSHAAARTSSASTAAILVGRGTRGSYRPPTWRRFSTATTREDLAMAVATGSTAAAPTFAGFSPDAIQFLADLAANNERAWFQPRKADYERLLKVPLEQFVAALGDRLVARNVPLRADPAHAPFRIYRDTRFSRDKSP